MQHLEVSEAVGSLKWSLGVKWLTVQHSHSFEQATGMQTFVHQFPANCSVKILEYLCTVWKKCPGNICS